MSKDQLDLAAEYALGLLSGEDLENARSLERSSANFRNEVARWHGRLVPLLDDVAEMQPPASAWSRISSETGGSGSRNERRPGHDASNVIELRRRVSQWRAAAGGMTALAACLAFVLLVGIPRPGPVSTALRPAPLVAMLGAPAEGTKVVASWDPEADQLVLAVPGELNSDARHAHELWIIPRGGKPRSLGTMPRSKQMHMRLAETLARLLEQGATIAISVEPRGGSPSGAPTGPVVASGALTQA